MTDDKVTRTTDGAVITVGLRVYWYSPQSMCVHYGAVLEIIPHSWVTIKLTEHKSKVCQVWYKQLYACPDNLVEKSLQHLDERIALYRRKMERFCAAKDQIVTMYGKTEDSDATNES